MKEWNTVFKKIDDYTWEIPKDYSEGMNVPGLIFSSEKMMDAVYNDEAYKQVINVAKLPGIVKYSMGMPDIHFGYGFPIGGVAAFDPKKCGIISPGGVGYDINCGVRLLRTNLMEKDIILKLRELVLAIASRVPAGVSSEGFLSLSHKDLDKVLIKGARWAVERGFGEKEDLEKIELNGEMPDAEASLLSSRAKERGLPQLGSLGAGNHFLEIQKITNIYNRKEADRFNIDEGQIMVMIHCGSRGLGYQVCEDYLSVMKKIQGKYGIKLPDGHLACAPIESKEGQEYLSAMAGAANYAWANRQIIQFEVDKIFTRIFGNNSKVDLIYDVAHNIARDEGGLCVHRKGATRAFPGFPVIIPGDMGTASYLLIGKEESIDKTFGSTCHGAGRKLSRHAAAKKYTSEGVLGELNGKGIEVYAASRKGIVEEAPGAYKDIDEVIEVVTQIGIAGKVARMEPLGVIKG